MSDSATPVSIKLFIKAKPSWNFTGWNRNFSNAPLSILTRICANALSELLQTSQITLHDHFRDTRKHGPRRLRYNGHCQAAQAKAEVTCTSRFTPKSLSTAVYHSLSLAPHITLSSATTRANPVETRFSIAMLSTIRPSSALFNPSRF